MPSFTLYFVFLLVWELPGHAEILVGQSVTHAQGKMDHLLAYYTGPQPLEGEVLHQEANNFQAVPGCTNSEAGSRRVEELVPPNLWASGSRYHP